MLGFHICCGTREDHWKCWAVISVAGKGVRNGIDLIYLARFSFIRLSFIHSVIHQLVSCHAPGVVLGFETQP